MNITKMKLSDCISPDFNPRTISEQEFENLKNSIRKYGYSDPIIVNKRNNHIVAGNQRHKALTELNRENHGKYTNIDVVLVDLDIEDEKAFNIGHNKISGDFDELKLNELLSELQSVDYDLSLTGFMEEEDNLDVDMEELDVLPEEIVPSDEEYVVTVKCTSLQQQEFLYDQLRNKGYTVKSMRY